MPSVFEQVLPMPRRGFFDTETLETATEFFVLLFQTCNVDQIAGNLTREDVEYLRLADQILAIQDAQPRAAARVDHLRIVKQYVENLLQAKAELDRAAERAARREERRVEHGPIQLNLNLDKDILTTILKSNNSDFLNQFLKLPKIDIKPIDLKLKDKILNNVRPLEEIINHYQAQEQEHDFRPIQNEVLREILRQQDRQNRADREILEYLERHGGLRPIIREEFVRRAERPAPARAAGVAAPATRSKVNTHTASIHKDASDSALRLQRAFVVKDFEPTMANLDWIFADKKLAAELMHLVTSELEYGEAIPDAAKLETTIRAAFSRNLGNTRFSDPTSKVTLSEALKLLLIAINSKFKDNAEVRKDAYLQLCKATYLLQEEYAYLPDIGPDSSSCEPGIFNGLLYSQATTLPEYVQIRMHAKSHAALALNDKLIAHALTLLKQGEYTDAAAFVEAYNKLVKENSLAIATEIFHAVVTDYYMVFGYKDEEAARLDIARTNTHCVMLCGCNLEDLFAAFPIDLEALYAEHQAQKTASTSSEAKPRPV